MTYSIDDIRRVFALTAVDEQKKILLLGAEASVIEAWRQQGVDVIAVDPSSQISQGDCCLKADYHQLPFTDYQFELALALNVLEQAQSIEDIQTILLSIAKVAEEIRVYPLHDDKHQSADWVAPILVQLQANNYGVELKEGANKEALLRIWANECVV